ncbi:MAG TPA: hypothetical protein VHZ24_21910 [Pirellulales bacterium]|nr:hypothetical protein [Pirellulales bacterium]
MNADNETLPRSINRTQRLAALVGIVAIAVCALGGLADPPQFFRAYLASYMFYLGLPLGAMVLVMIYHLTGGAWGYVMRWPLESAMRTLPGCAIAFLPIALGASYLYLWAQPDTVAADPELQKKTFYLTLPLYWARMAGFFALWVIVATLLARWSRKQEETGEQRYATWLTNLSGPGLLAYGVAMNFASIDWLMSLQPAFHSTIFGPLVATGHILSAFCVATIVVCAFAHRGPLGELISEKVLNDIGSLMFAFVIIWAYMNWFQFMLIWLANMETDVTWYKPRLGGGWQWVALALVLLHFVVPFFLLLSRRVKRQPRVLGTIAAGVLFMHLVFLNWQVLPSFEAASLIEHWMDFVMPIGLGGLWLASYLGQLARRPSTIVADENRILVEHLRASDDEELAWEESLAHG